MGKRKTPFYWAYLIKLGSSDCGEILGIDEIEQAGALIGLGLASAEHGYEGPRIKLTDKGRAVFEAPRITSIKPWDERFNRVRR